MAKAGGGGGGLSRFRTSTTGGSITKLSSSIDGVTPFIQVSYKVPGTGGQTVTENTILSGTTTDTLTIRCDSVKTQSVTCEIDGGSIPTIPAQVTSDSANFYSISESNLEQSELTLAIIDDEVGTVSASVTNLFQQNLNLIPSTDSALKSFIVYSIGQNVPVRITLDGGGGSDYGSTKGGAGGRTVFDYTLLADTEYVFKLSKPFGNLQGGTGAYFYEKGKLLVVSGGGGSAGSGPGSIGGNGGGAGIQGTGGVGSGGGAGGRGVLDGQLSADGVLTAGTSGGSVESCTSGFYWAAQGKGPCEDVGKVRFRTATGSEVSQSTNAITRGYKADLPYDDGALGFRVNGGYSFFGNGGGGSGAVGGDAATNGVGGGGGGSGYSNGTVTIVSTGTNPEGAGAPSRALIELRT